MDNLKWQSGINICIDNVKSLVKDGKLLMDKESIGHATFLFLTAFEEIAVAYYIIHNFNQPKPNQLNTRRFLSHLKKFSFSRFYTFLLSGDFEFFVDYFDIVKKIVEDQKEDDSNGISEEELIILEKKIQKKDDIWTLRNNSLYVSLNPKTLKYQTPKNINKDIAQNLFYRLNLIILKLEIDRELVFNFGSTSVQFDLTDIKFLESFYKIYTLIKATNENNKKQVYKLTRDNIQLRRLLLKIKKNPQTIKNPVKMSLLINLMLKDYALIIINILNDRENKVQFEYIMKYLKKKNPISAEFFDLNIKILNEIAQGIFKIESYPELYNYLLNLEDSNNFDLNTNDINKRES